MFLSVTPEWIYLIEAACVFNDSQHLDEKEKEQWDWANDNKSAEGCTKDDFNSTEFPSRPPPPTHTGAHTLDKTAELITSTLLLMGLAHCRGRGVGRVTSMCQE